MAKRERGDGRVFLRQDPADPKRRLQTWWIDYHVDGRRYRESSKSRKKTDALVLLRLRMGEHATGQYVGADAKRLTFEDLEAGVVSSYELKGHRSLDRLRAGFNHLREHFAGWKATAITARALEHYATDRLKEAARATVKYELAVLRRAMTLAVKRGALAARPSFPEIGVQNARVGFFERAEFEAVVKELPDPLKRIALVGYNTGWRKSEILGLTWARIDLGHGIMRLEPTSKAAGTSTKNNEGRTFPFGEVPALLEALRVQRACTEEVQRRNGEVIPWVWHRDDGSRIRSIDEAWRSACKRAGYPGRLFHDLRRTAARNLIRAGVPEHWAMQLCGHRSPEVFRRYAITSEADLKQAVALLANLPSGARSSVIPLKAAGA
ncbi:MAG TPA: site-specific integrase [Gemmatimonadales bacterium]|nr:site-specific integrase [Gemmatimonadales bacterium]